MGLFDKFKKQKSTPEKRDYALEIKEEFDGIEDGCVFLPMYPDFRKKVAEWEEYEKSIENGNIEDANLYYAMAIDACQMITMQIALGTDDDWAGLAQKCAMLAKSKNPKNPSLLKLYKEGYEKAFENNTS